MKIHAYGCSFTNYKWPTYADILGEQYNAINRGNSGSGNERIFYHFMEDFKNENIDSKDIVIFQWSGLTRFDYLTSGSAWMSPGNVLNKHDKDAHFVYSKIRNWFNPDYEFEKIINYILCCEYLTKHIGCRTLQMSLVPIQGHDSDFLDNNLYNNYEGTYKFYYQPWVKKRKKVATQDKHPTVMQHYDLAQRVAEKLNLEFNIDYNKVEKLHNLILEVQDFRRDYFFI